MSPVLPQITEKLGKKYTELEFTETRTDKQYEDELKKKKKMTDYAPVIKNKNDVLKI